jgi:hypothetical protein
MKPHEYLPAIKHGNGKSFPQQNLYNYLCAQHVSLYPVINSRKNNNKNHTHWFHIASELEHHHSSIRKIIYNCTIFQFAMSIDPSFTIFITI